MKKSLSLLLAIAMVFSMFATVAAADELDTQAKFEALKEVGIFEGMPDGSAGLDQEMTRAQFAVVIYRLFEKSGSPLADAQQTFSDVADNHWAAKEIGAVQNAGYMEGRGNGKFDPSAPVTAQELLKVVAVILGLEIDANATVSGNAKPWAQPYVAAAEKAGLVQPQADYTQNALRGLLVDVTYNAYQQIQSAAKLTASAKQTGAKKIELTFSKAIDDSKATFAVKNGLADRVVDKYTVSDDKKTVVLELTTKLQSAETTVTIKGVDSEDVVAKFTAEDERVTQVKFKSDKLALSVGQDNLPNYNEVKVGYQILNQFGEEVSNVSDPVFQAAKATAEASGANGVLTIKTDKSAPFYLGESIVVTGYLRLSTYAVTISETLTVGQPATVDSVEFKGLYHAENKELNTNSEFDQFVVLIEAKDQYGNKLNASQFNAGAFVTVTNPSIFQVASQDPATDNNGANKDQVGIVLADPAFKPGFDGTNTIRVTTLTGKTFTYNVEVKKAATVQKITLLTPSQVVAANDGTVKIPFVAEDQFGNEIKKYNDLNGKITLSPAPSATRKDGVVLKQDYATKEAYIELILPDPVANQQVAIPYTVMAMVNGTPNSSVITINIEKPAVPDSLVGLTSDVAANLAKGATTTIKPEYIKLKDNYGRDMELKKVLDDANDYEVRITAVDGTFDVVKLIDAANNEVNSVTFTASNQSITVKAAEKGGERIRIQLVDPANKADEKDVIISTYESFIFNVVDSSAFASYEVEQLPRISNKAGHEVELKVYGVRSNGTKVQLTPNDFHVVTTHSAVEFVGGKLDASKVADNDGAFGGSSDEFKIKVIVNIVATGERFEQEAVITKEALRVATIELKDAAPLKVDNGIVKGAAGNISVLNIFNTLKIKDQFGVEYSPSAADFNVSIYNTDDVQEVKGKELKVVDNGKDATTVKVENVDTGDSFNVIFTSKQTGVSIDVRVVAE